MNDLERFVKVNFISRNLAALGITLVVVVALRLVIYYWLRTHGYFYGVPWDSFSRTLISYAWVNEPFFSLSDSYWLPLQFWLVGSVFALIRPWIPTSEILVPVFINNIFFIGSVSVLFLLMLKISKKPILAFLACALAGLFAGDVFVSYSALSEPMLIFFILLASYFFYEMYTGERGDNPQTALMVSIVVLLAAATHYIGWFLAIFFCLYFLRYLVAAFRQKKYQQCIFFVVAIAFCAIFPMIWTMNNLIYHENPLNFIQTAQHHQEKYIGKLDLINRFLNPPGILLKEFYPLAIPGLITLALVWRKKAWRTLVYTLPGGFVFSLIWISTIFAFSAPYQEPRYFVFAGWLLIPLIVFGGSVVWDESSHLRRILLGFVFLAIILLNFYQVTNFRNSFDENVRGAGIQTRLWIQNQPSSARVILNQDSFAEANVIPLISGYPDHFILVSDEQMHNAYPDPKHFLESKADIWLCITKDRDFAKKAREQGLTAKHINKYFFITP